MQRSREVRVFTSLCIFCNCGEKIKSTSHELTLSFNNLPGVSAGREQLKTIYYQEGPFSIIDIFRVRTDVNLNLSCTFHFPPLALSHHCFALKQLCWWACLDKALPTTFSETLPSVLRSVGINIIEISAHHLQSK